MQTYWSIFWRTFSNLALATLLAVQGLDFVNPSVAKSNVIALGLGLLVAFVGALAAALWAFALSPAVTAIEKAFRAAAQAAAGGLAAIGVNEAADLIALPHVLLGLVIAVAFAFAITFFSNQGTVPPATTSP